MLGQVLLFPEFAEVSNSQTENVSYYCHCPPLPIQSFLVLSSLPPNPFLGSVSSPLKITESYLTSDALTLIQHGFVSAFRAGEVISKIY